MERPILNPQNPYVGTLRVFPGTMVRVAGRPVVNATRFAINFQTGPSLNPRDDLALHLSPCFTPPRIVRNSLQAGQWGLEEAWGNGMLVTPHQPFEIIILAEQDQFKIAINGAHFCEFRHRIPYQAITHLTIDGDVDIERITITEAASSPAPYQASAPPQAPAAYHNAPYPPATGGMPMPPMYPNLGPSQTAHAGGAYPSMPGPAGPVPTAASYGSGGYPAAPPPTGAYPQVPGYMPAGPAPTGATYQGGYPNLPQQQHQQPHHPQQGSSSGLPFGLGGKALGTVAGVLKEGVYRKFPLARHFL